jgi:hypothetical protein
MASRKGRVTKGTTSKGSVTKGKITRSGNKPQMNLVKAGIIVEGEENLYATLAVLETKFENPTPAVQLVQELFVLMEKQAFAHGGVAPEFGLSAWKPLSQRTLANRRGMGNYDTKPLVNFGYLAEAATNPRYIPVGTGAALLLIDPNNKMYAAPKGYSNGENYALRHQTGNLDGGRSVPVRKVVRITPQFRQMARELVSLWLTSGIKPHIDSASTNKSFGLAKRSYNKRRKDFIGVQKKRATERARIAKNAKARERYAIKKQEKEQARIAKIRQDKFNQNLHENKKLIDDTAFNSFANTLEKLGKASGTEHARRMATDLKRKALVARTRGMSYGEFTTQYPEFKHYMPAYERAEKRFAGTPTNPKGLEE